MRKCRFCQKEIQASSVVCEHCGRELIPGRSQPNLKLSMPVTTGDVKQDYEILGPVYFQVSNKGLFSSALSKLIQQYEAEIADARKQGQVGERRADWSFLYGEYSVGQSDFEKAFFVAVQELKKRAAMLGADAVVGMRQDIDLDTNTFQFFYLQMYGTAVKFK
jgi:Putative heavy-metal-binding